MNIHFQERVGEDTPIVLVGNKTDFDQTEWKVSSKKAEAFARLHGLHYIETSAVGLVNIDEIFCILIHKMIDRQNKPAMSMAETPEPIDPSMVSLITERETVQPLHSLNIQLLPENDINGNHRSNKNRWSRC